MIILVGNQKGGCGKSTTAVNLSACLAHKGSDVLLVDADKQGTATNWVRDRQETQLPVVNSVQKSDNIHHCLLDLAQRYQVVVVDAAGRDSRDLRTGMIAADILLMPFRPSQPDLDTLPTMQEILTSALDLNPKLQPFALLTMAPTNPAINEIAQSKSVFADSSDIQLLETIIFERKVYRDGMSEGRGVVEMSNSKAAAEFQSLVTELSERANLNFSNKSLIYA